MQHTTIKARGLEFDALTDGKDAKRFGNERAEFARMLKAPDLSAEASALYLRTHAS
ncbi:MAG: hypothetical protein R2770_01090 [Acidimicrobiales bacterium]